MRIGALQLFANPVRERQTGGINLQPKETPVGQFGGAKASVAGINGELSPQYLASATTGSTYTNGRGHSAFTLNYLA